MNGLFQSFPCFILILYILLFYILIESLNAIDTNNNNNNNNENEEQTTCMNNCSGHGQCREYTCTCYPGYIGLGCGTRLVQDDLDIYPTLTVGSYNLTDQNYTSIVNKKKMIVIGFSSLSCIRCITAENEYYNLFKYYLMVNKIDFARVNVDDNQFIVSQYHPFVPPHIKICQYGKCYSYENAHNAKSMIKYIQKLAKEPSIKLFNLQGVKLFLNEKVEDYSPNNMKNKHCYVLSYFGNIMPSKSSTKYDEEIDEYHEAAITLRSNSDFSFGEIYNDTSTKKKKNSYYYLKTIQKMYKNENFFENIKSAPALSIRCHYKVGNNGKASTFSSSLNLDSFYGGERTSLDKWIVAHSLQLVGGKL